MAQGQSGAEFFKVALDEVKTYQGKMQLHYKFSAQKFARNLPSETSKT